MWVSLTAWQTEATQKQETTLFDLKWYTWLKWQGHISQFTVCLFFHLVSLWLKRTWTFDVMFTFKSQFWKRPRNELPFFRQAKLSHYSDNMLCWNKHQQLDKTSIFSFFQSENTVGFEVVYVPAAQGWDHWFFFILYDTQVQISIDQFNIFIYINHPAVWEELWGINYF